MSLQLRLANMIRLIYTSRSLSKLPLDLKEILAQSRANNERREISGALCFLDGVYFQYLEGETVVLEDLYRTILADPRHTDPRLVERKFIETRLFDSWSMALVTWNQETKEIFETLNGPGPMDVHGIKIEAAATFFKALSRSSNWMEV